MKILDSRGNIIPDVKKKIDSCPGCGAGRDKRRPVLGGKEVCMQCGLEVQGDQEAESRQRPDIS